MLKRGKKTCRSCKKASWVLQANLPNSVGECEARKSYLGGKCLTFRGLFLSDGSKREDLKWGAYLQTLIARGFVLPSIKPEIVKPPRGRRTKIYSRRHKQEGREICQAKVSSVLWLYNCLRRKDRWLLIDRACCHRGLLGSFLEASFTTIGCQKEFG